MASVRGWQAIDYRGALSAHRDAKALTIWQTGALAAGLLTGSSLDNSGILSCGCVLLLGLALLLSVRPWPGEEHPPFDLMTGDMRDLVRKSQRSHAGFCFAVTAFALCRALADPAGLWIAVGIGGFFAAWGLQALAGLLYIHHDRQRLAVWTLCAQGCAFVAAGVLFDGGLGVALLEFIFLAIACRSTRAAGPKWDEPGGSAIEIRRGR